MSGINSEIFELVRIGRNVIGMPDFRPEMRGNDGRTLVHEAIAYRQDALVPELLGAGVPVDAQDGKGQTALHYAAVYGSKLAAAELLRHRANPNVLDRYGNGPLWTGALSSKGDLELVKLLLEHGADPTHKNGASRSTLDFAAQSGNRNLAELCEAYAHD